jgi:hypothetical protein
MIYSLSFYNVYSRTRLLQSISRDFGQGIQANCSEVVDSYFTVCTNLHDVTHRYGDVKSNRRWGLKVEDIYSSHEHFGAAGESTSLSANKAHRFVARTWLADTSHAGISIVSMASSHMESYGKKSLFPLM